MSMRPCRDLLLCREQSPGLLQRASRDRTLGHCLLEAAQRLGGSRAGFIGQSLAIT